jgi:flagellar basal body-associated protein FliL
VYSNDAETPANGKKVKILTVLLLLAVSAILCAAVCGLFWASDKNNPVQSAVPSAQASILNG